MDNLPSIVRVSHLLPRGYRPPHLSDSVRSVAGHCNVRAMHVLNAADQRAACQHDILDVRYLTDLCATDVSGGWPGPGAFIRVALTTMRVPWQAAWLIPDGLIRYLFITHVGFCTSDLPYRNRTGSRASQSPVFGGIRTW